MKRAALALVAMGLMTGAASAASVSFTELSGLAGGSPAATGVFQADLSGLGIGTISSITIHDNSGGLGSAAGQFSGFDLDAVVISTVNISDASFVGTLTPAATFDFDNTIFTPGTVRGAKGRAT